MTFKVSGLKVAVATSVLACAISTISPAHALTFNGKSNGQTDLLWNAQITTGNADFLDFLNSTGPTAGQFVVSNQTGAFENLPTFNFGELGFRAKGQIKDTGLPIPVAPDIGSTVNVSLPNFITFDGANNSIFGFTVTSITRAQLNRYRFDGFFGSNSNDLGYFDLSDQDGLSYSGTLYAVPTPALLPGLVGVILGVLRQRRFKTTEETAS